MQKSPSDYCELFIDSGWSILLLPFCLNGTFQQPLLVFRVCESGLQQTCLHVSPNCVFAFWASAFVRVAQRSSRPPSHFPRSNSLTWQTIIKEKQMDGLRHPPNDISRWLRRRETERERKKTAGGLLASRRKTKIVSSKKACETLVIFWEMWAAEVWKGKKKLQLTDYKYGMDVFCEWIHNIKIAISQISHIKM